MRLWPWRNRARRIFGSSAQAQQAQAAWSVAMSEAAGKWADGIASVSLDQWRAAAVAKAPTINDLARREMLAQVTQQSDSDRELARWKADHPELLSGLEDDDVDVIAECWRAAWDGGYDTAREYFDDY